MSMIFGDHNNQPELKKGTTLHNFSSAHVDNIKPVHFVLAPAGSYQDQHHRSWESNQSIRSINAITDALRQTAANKVNPAMIATSGGLLSVAQQSQGRILIPNGWGARRGIFILALDFFMRNGEVYRYYIQGMTDSGEFTDRNIAPQLTFYVNNVVVLRPTHRQQSGVTTSRGFVVHKNYQPLTRFTEQSQETTSEITRLVRPRDVMARASNSALESNGDYRVVDESVSLGRADISTSKRINSIPSLMTTRLINAYVTSAEVAAEDIDTTTGDIAERAYGQLDERDSMDDEFFNMLRNRNSFSTTSFTWSHLVGLIPTLPDIRTPVKEAMRGYQFHESGDSDSFGSSAATTKAMANLQSSVPSMMLQCMLTGISVYVTNKTFDRQPALKWMYADFFEPGLANTMLPQFEARFNQEIVPSLAADSDVEYECTITAAYNGEIEVKMNINDREAFMVAPAFCDSLFSPTMTGDSKVAGDVSRQLTTVCSTIADQILTDGRKRDARTLRDLDGRPEKFAGIKQGDVIGVSMSREKRNAQNRADGEGAPAPRSSLERLVGGGGRRTADFGGNASDFSGSGIGSLGSRFRNRSE